MLTWRERCVAARERGAFTHAEHDFAFEWGTCAVGEQARLHPERVAVYPVRFDGLKEERLFELGTRFVGHVGLACLCRNYSARTRLECINAAERVLDQIEDRVLELKREAREEGRP